MNIPGFTAEASAYKTHNAYRLAAGGNSPNPAKATVTPQDCGVVKTIGCSALIAGGVSVCTASCLAGAQAGALGGIPCAGCWAGFGITVGSACYDCIPGWMR